MLNEKTLYANAETDYYPNNGKYAKLLSFKKNISIDFKFDLVHFDFGHFATSKFHIVSTGTNIKIYDLHEEHNNLKFYLVAENDNYALYVKGLYTGNPIKIYINSLSKINYLDLNHFGEFKYDENDLKNKAIKLDTPIKNNGKRIYLSDNNVKNNWHVNLGSYIIREDTCFIDLNLADGLTDDGSVVLSNLPYPFFNSSEPSIIFTGIYQKYDDNNYYNCLLTLNGNGELKISNVKGNKNLIGNISYPVFRKQY